MVKVSDILNKMNLSLISGEKGLENEITEMVLSKPGIELAGYEEYFESGRVQIMGTKEISYFKSLSEEQKEKSLEFIFRNDLPCIVFSNNNDIPELFKKKSIKYCVPILHSKKTSTSLYVEIFDFLSKKLAPRQSVHGVLMNIKGRGVLIVGDSGIGKSEVALELIKKGYQLIADDRVDIFEEGYGNILGEAPKVSRGFLEVRGMGIIDIISMYGAGSYDEQVKINLIVELKKYDKDETYSRLGTQEKVTYFDTEVDKITLPVYAGRNLSTLVEVASIQNRLKKLGYDSNKEFVARINKEIKGE